MDSIVLRDIPGCIQIMVARMSLHSSYIARRSLVRLVSIFRMYCVPEKSKVGHGLRCHTRIGYLLDVYRTQIAHSMILPRKNSARTAARTMPRISITTASLLGWQFRCHLVPLQRLAKSFLYTTDHSEP